jgi:hypothetical protein
MQYSLSQDDAAFHPQGPELLTTDCPDLTDQLSFGLSIRVISAISGSIPTLVNSLPFVILVPFVVQIDFQVRGGFGRGASKNGAHFPIWRVAGGWRQAEFLDLKSARFLAYDLEPSVRQGEKMAVCPPKNRQFPPLFVRFLPVFSGFFCELGDEAANWRESDSERGGRDGRSSITPVLYPPVWPVCGQSLDTTFRG